MALRGFFQRERTEVITEELDLHLEGTEHEKIKSKTISHMTKPLDFLLFMRMWNL